MVYHSVRANSPLIQSSFFLGGSVPLEESLRGEHSPGCNHLFSFITGEMEKVREIIRTLEWSQSSTPPVRSPLRVIHLASLPPPHPFSPLPFSSPLNPSSPSLSQGFGHRHYSWTSAARWIFHSLRRDEKGAAPLTWKLTCRHRDYGRAVSFQAELGHAETCRAGGTGLGLIEAE